MAADLTKEQIQTIDSIQGLDDDGYLYEMTYYADYKIDEIIGKFRDEKKDRLGHIRDSLFCDSKSEPVKVKSLYIPGGCSAFFSYDKNGNPIFSRNYDWKDMESTIIVMHTPAIEGARFASLSTTDGGHVGIRAGKNVDPDKKERFLYAPFCGASDGINERGFCVGIQVLYQKTPLQNGSKPALDVGLVARYLLDKAESVNHAIELLSAFDVKHVYERSGSLHWIISDITGNRAILEYVEGRLCIIKNPPQVGFDEKTGKTEVSWTNGEKDYLICTNHYVSREGSSLSKGSPGGYWRYAKLQSLLSENKTPSLGEAMQMLKEVCYTKDIAVNFYSGVKLKIPSITLVSCVYDMKKGEMRLCLREDYSKEYSFRL